MDCHLRQRPRRFYQIARDSEYNLYVSFRVFLAFLCLAISAPAGIRAQAAPSAGCVQDKERFTCNATAFAAALKNAATIAVSSQPPNQMADGQLENLVRSLGKTGTPGEADLTFVLAKIDYSGVNYGPGDRELAALRIYSHGIEGARGPLLWDEPFIGEPDMAWPTVVHELIAQFKTDIKQLPR